MKRILVVSSLTFALLTGGGAAVAAPAAAPRPYCVLHLSQGGTTDCYATFTEAIADGTDGQVTDAPATTEAAGDALDRRLDAAAVPAGSPAALAAAGGTVIGIQYWHIDFEGAAWVVEANHACDRDKGYAEWQSSFPGHAWDNQISSAKVFAGCYAFFWDTPNYDVYGVAIAGDTSDFRSIGTWNPRNFNDMTTSIYWT
ncbi:hypothetical protein [Longispora urticae]